MMDPWCGGDPMETSVAHRVVLDKIELGFSQLITEEYVNDVMLPNPSQVNVVRDAMLRAWRVEMRAHLLGLKDETRIYQITWPATWWDHLKMDLSERWPWLFEGLRYEMQATSTEVHLFDAVCPHLRADGSSERRWHIEWLHGRSERRQGR
jgi:hypothetical protein